jgi:hypothetical protein
MRLPTCAELKRFCEVDGWFDSDARRGAKTGDHFRYGRVVRDGTRLRTRVSHGSGSIRDPTTFNDILRSQLQVTEEQFWLAVDKGVAPSRPGDTPPEPPGPGLPYDLVKNLTTRAGLVLEDVLRMSKDEAVAAWQEWPTSGGAAPEEEPGSR